MGTGTLPLCWLVLFPLPVGCCAGCNTGMHLVAHATGDMHPAKAPHVSSGHCQNMRFLQQGPDVRMPSASASLFCRCFWTSQHCTQHASAPGQDYRPRFAITSSWRVCFGSPRDSGTQIGTLEKVIVTCTSQCQTHSQATGQQGLAMLGLEQLGLSDNVSNLGVPIGIGIAALAGAGMYSALTRGSKESPSVPGERTCFGSA
jgi:hypothetical protein